MFAVAKYSGESSLPGNALPDGFRRGKVERAARRLAAAGTTVGRALGDPAEREHARGGVADRGTALSETGLSETGTPEPDRGLDAGPRLRRWTDRGLDRDRVLRDVRTIFYEASGTQSFASEAERHVFEERWLGRYLSHDAGLFHLLEMEGGRIAGYLAGSLDDPALAPRFRDIGYFEELAPLTARFPAHLHINLAPDVRSKGLGRRLISAFLEDCRTAGIAGCHVVTGRGVRNVRFYGANGFSEQGSVMWNGRELIFLAHALGTVEAKKGAAEGAQPA